MKSKSISFAEVLRKTARSPRVEPAGTGLSLEELVRRFENDPSEDYTLYLGHFNASHRSKPSSSRMAFSRNTVGNQEEMFDSWIQKQSTLGANKENIRNQPLKSNRNEPIKRSEVGNRKNITTSKAKQDSYPANAVNSHYQRQTNQYEEPQHTFPSLNIEMVKSNSYQNEHGVNKIKSPKKQNRMQPIQLPPPITVQYDRPKFAPSERPTQIKVEPTFKEIKQSKQSERLQSQFCKMPERSNSFAKLPEQQSHQSFEAEQFQAEISDITNKYMNNSPEKEPQDQELLLQNSLPLRAQEEMAFDQTYAKKAQQQEDIMKKRMEDAKSMIGNYLDKLKKDRQEEKKDDFYIMNPHFGAKQSNHSNNMVGYSFSNNHFMGVNQSPQNQQQTHPQTYIPDVVSEAPEESDEPMKDSMNFKNKYLNLESFEVQHNEHIQNIQSVRYEGEDNHRNPYEEQRPFDIPNGTSKFQALSSKERQNHFSDHYETKQVQPLQQIAKEEVQSMKSIKSFESNHLETQNVAAKPNGRSKQKISLISSKSRSNKTSPTATTKQKQADVATTDFALSLPKQERPQQTKFQQTTYAKPEDTKSSFKKGENYQFSSKTEEIQSRPWQHNRFSTYITAKQQHYSTSITPPEPKVQEVRKYEYIAPTYTKPPSRLADITSDYYSTANYNPVPAYQAGSHYDAPTYGNQSKNSFASYKNHEQLPLKLETPYEFNSSKEQPKKESSYSVAATNSYEQKYALPTSYANNAEKQTKKGGYLSQLDIKQSITIEDPKAKQEPTYATTKNSNSNLTYGNISKQFKTVNPIASTRNSLKLSLKQSINVASSEQFIFDL